MGNKLFIHCSVWIMVHRWRTWGSFLFTEHSVEAWKSSGDSCWNTFAETPISTPKLSIPFSCEVFWQTNWIKMYLLSILNQSKQFQESSLPLKKDFLFWQLKYFKWYELLYLHLNIQHWFHYLCPHNLRLVINVFFGLYVQIRHMCRYQHIKHTS